MARGSADFGQISSVWDLSLSVSCLKMTIWRLQNTNFLQPSAAGKFDVFETFEGPISLVKSRFETMQYPIFLAAGGGQKILPFWGAQGPDPVPNPPWGWGGPPPTLFI